MPQRFACILVACILGIFTSRSLADEGTYKIIFHQPDRVGQMYRLTASGTIKRTFAWKIPVVRQPDPVQFAGELAATEKVLALEPNSQDPYKAEFNITVLKRDQVEQLLPGTVVVGENLNGQTHYTINGVAVNPEMDDTLQLLMTGLHAANNPHTDDEAVGVNEPQKVGGTWPLHAAQAAREWSNPSFTVDEKDVSGKMTLQAVDITPKGPLLHIKRAVEVKNMHGDWVEDRKVESGHGLDESECILSSGSALRKFEMRDTAKVTYESSVRTSDGAVNPMSVTTERTLKSTSVPIEASSTQPVTQK